MKITLTSEAEGEGGFKNAQIEVEGASCGMEVWESLFGAMVHQSEEVEEELEEVESAARHKKHKEDEIACMIMSKYAKLTIQLYEKFIEEMDKHTT